MHQMWSGARGEHCSTQATTEFCPMMIPGGHARQDSNTRTKRLRHNRASYQRSLSPRPSLVAHDIACLLIATFKNLLFLCLFHSLANLHNTKQHNTTHTDTHKHCISILLPCMFFFQFCFILRLSTYTQ